MYYCNSVSIFPWGWHHHSANIFHVQMCMRKYATTSMETKCKIYSTLWTILCSTFGLICGLTVSLGREKWVFKLLIVQCHLEPISEMWYCGRRCGTLVIDMALWLTLVVWHAVCWHCQPFYIIMLQIRMERFFMKTCRSPVTSIKHSLVKTYKYYYKTSFFI